jgi:ribose 5-phosphate isomerase B
MGAQIIGIKLAEDILSAFLSAEFSIDEHFRRRVAKLTDMEIRAARELLDRS